MSETPPAAHAAEAEFVQSLPVASEVLAAGHELAEPALQWMDGHVLGNGDLGAVLWGHAEQVFIGFSKHDINDLRGAEHGARWAVNYPEMRRRTMAGERFDPGALGDTTEHDPRWPCPLPAGRLVLETLRGVQAEGFRQRLSFVNAECEVTSVPTRWGWSWGMKFAPVVTRVLVSAERNVALIELSSELPQRVHWGFEQNPNLPLDAPVYTVQVGAAGPVGVAAQELIREQSFAVAIGASTARFEATGGEQGLQGVIEFGGEAGPAVLMVSLATEREAGGPPTARALELLDAALAVGYDSLRQEHQAWWRRFWEAAQVDYEDADVARIWHMGLYALASSTRPHTSPPHLQGLWNQFDVPPWHSDFHFNANIQECQWLPCAANHPELQAAMVRVLIHDWREEERRLARECYEAPGLCVPFASDWLGRNIGGIWGGVQLSLTAWTAQHVWWQWQYTRDERLLREEIYPFLRECCEFYPAVLVRDAQGIWNSELSLSPEQVAPDAEGNWYSVNGRNPNIDIANCRLLFTVTVEAAEILGIEDPFLATVQDMRDHLPPFPTEGGVLIDYETGFFRDGDRPGRFPYSHRHPSRLTPIFPAGWIGLHSDPETLELGRRSFADFRGHGEEGFTGWSEGWQTCLAARLGLGAEAEARLHCLVDHFLLPGMLTSHNAVDGAYGMGNGPLFQIEALFGAAAGVTEMLMQATGGVLRVFPAVPEGRRAAFADLRAPGGHLLSARREAEGVAEVEIQAALAGPLQLANPWPGRGARLETEGGSQVLSGATLEWEAQAGKTYRLTPA
jgi:alpha-L-fucosidase 2